MPTPSPGSPERIHKLLDQLVREIEFGVASGQIPESTDFSFVLTVPSIAGAGWVTGGKVMTSPFPAEAVERALQRASDEFARPFEELRHE